MSVFTLLVVSLEATDPMGVVLMRKRELNRIDVLARLHGRRLTVSAAANLMRANPSVVEAIPRWRCGCDPAAWSAVEQLTRKPA